MWVRTGSALAVLATVGMLSGTAVRAGELGFLEMLFGIRLGPQRVHRAWDESRHRPRARVGAARHRLRTQYAALPVKIRVSDRQTPIDMAAGAAAAFMKDETLRPGDIVILSNGARVFVGQPDKRHSMSDFEPVQNSAYVAKSTRQMLAGMMTPMGALPADAARRMTMRATKTVPAAGPVTTEAAAMRVINPWQVKTSEAR